VAEREKAKAERAAHDAEIAKKQAETAKLALDVAKVALEACKQGGCKKVALKAAEDALRKAESVNSQAQAAVDKADKSLSDLARRAKENYEYNTRPWNGSPDDFWPAAGRELLGLPGDIVGLAVDRVEEIATGDPYGSSANPDD
jgi:multidrug efflux pump subunit AcrA (membrane-fusion protein)